MDRWFNSPPRKSGKKRRLLVVLDPRLFSVRDSKGLPIAQWDIATLAEAGDKWDQIVVLERRSFQKGVEEQNLLFDLKDKPLNLAVIPCWESVLVTTEQLRKKVLDFGGKIKHVKNPREITYLNMCDFVEADNIVWIQSWNQTELAEIEPEKPKTFDDFSRSRKVRAYW